MADNITALANTGTGTDILATDEIGGVHYPRSKVGFGSDGSYIDVSAANPFPVQISRLLFTSSAVNSSSAQLAAAATFTGTWEDIFSQPDAQVLSVSDQAMTYEIQQAIDAAGLQIISTTTFTRIAGQGLCENVQLNGNYVRVRATNNGASSTTTFAINTTYGILDPLPTSLTNRGNLRVSVEESEAAPLTTYNVAGVIAINTVLTTLDCSQYSSVSVQCVSMGTTGAVTPEWSNDNTNWQPATLQTGAGATATTFNAAGLWTLPVMARYLRFRLSTATTAGTTTIQYYRLTQRAQHWLATQPISGTVTATVGTSITGGAIAPLTLAGVTVETSAARTTTANGTTTTNASGSGAMFYINVSASSGTLPTLVVQLQVQDPVSLAFIDVAGAATASLVTTGLVMLTVAPGIVEATNTKVSQGLPRTYRFRWTIGGTTPSFTFSIGAQYLL